MKPLLGMSSRSKVGKFNVSRTQVCDTGQHYECERAVETPCMHTEGRPYSARLSAAWPQCTQDCGNWFFRISVSIRTDEWGFQSSLLITNSNFKQLSHPGAAFGNFSRPATLRKSSSHLIEEGGMQRWLVSGHCSSASWPLGGRPYQNTTEKGGHTNWFQAKFQ